MSIFDRFFGAPDIQKLKQRGNVQGLLRSLGYTASTLQETQRIHRMALDALAEIGEAAVQPAFDEYLNPKRKSRDRALLVVLREIGKRTSDQYLRLTVSEKLGMLIDLRKVNHITILQALYSLACLPNLPTFLPAAQQIFRSRLQNPNSAIRVESTLGMLITSVQMREFVDIDGWFEKVQAFCAPAPAGDEEPEAPNAVTAQRTAVALGQAAPVFTDTYIRVKAVALLFSLIEIWKENQPVCGAVEAALVAYPVTAVPLLLTRLEKDPKDALANQTIEVIGKRMLGGPHEPTFLEMIVPYLEHQSWDIRQAAALILRAIDWKPASAAAQTNLLIAARSFSLSAWTGIQIDRDLIEQLADTIDDPHYPASADLVRHIALIHPQISDREARFRLRGVLARCLESQPIQVQPFIVRGLAALDWQPGTDIAAVIYWIYQGEWERIVAIVTYSFNRAGFSGSLSPVKRGTGPLGTGPLKMGNSGTDTAGRAGTGPLGAGQLTSSSSDNTPMSSLRSVSTSAGVAVDVLIDCLSSPEIQARKTAARALSAIYQSGTADVQTRSRILATTSRIEEYYQPDSSGA